MTNLPIELFGAMAREINPISTSWLLDPYIQNTRETENKMAVALSYILHFEDITLTLQSVIPKLLSWVLRGPL